MSADRRAGTAQLLLGMASFVVIVAGMKAAQAILIPFLLAAFIALLMAPLLFWLQDRGLPSPIALFVVIMVVLGVGVVLAGLIGGSIQAFTTALPGYQARFQQLVATATGWLAAHDIEIFAKLGADTFDPSAVIGVAGGLAGGLGAMLNNALMIFLTVCFILLEASSFPSKIAAATSDSADVADRMEDIGEAIRRYLGIKALTSVGTGVIIYLWLLATGVSFPMLFGLLAFLLNFVPTIGSIVAAVPAVLLALVDGGTSLAALTGFAFLAVNILIGSVIEPRVMGMGVGLSPLVVLISLGFWGYVLGPVGMVLAVPLTVIVRIILAGRRETHWLAVLLGPASAATPLPSAAASETTTEDEASEQAPA